MFTRGAAARGPRAHEPPSVSERLALAPGAEEHPPLDTSAALGMPPAHNPARGLAVGNATETLTSGTPLAPDTTQVGAAPFGAGTADQGLHPPAGPNNMSGGLTSPAHVQEKAKIDPMTTPKAETLTTSETSQIGGQ